MVDQSDVIAYINAHQDRFIEELKTLLRIPSVSAQESHNADTHRCAAWLVNHLKGLGLDARLIETKLHPIVWATGKGTSRKRIIFYGHYDVQPEDPADQWHSPPFEPQVRDGFLYGRGTTDDKGQIWSQIKAIEAILKTEGQLPCDVLFLLEGEEECGGSSLSEFIKQEKAALADADAVMVSDGSLFDEETPAISQGLRGTAFLEILIKGPQRDVHSGIFGGAIANPVVVLAQLLSRCVDAEGRVQIPGFYDQVQTLTPSERADIVGLPHDDPDFAEKLGVRRLFGEKGYTTLERIWARPTFEINGIYGGYQGPGGKTIIPASAGAKLTMRLVPHQDGAVILKQTIDFLRQHCPDTVTFEIVGQGSCGPVFFDRNHPMLQKAAAALETGFGCKPVFIREGGSIPVVETFWRELGLPVLLVGFGLSSDGAHAPNERFKIDNLIGGIKTVVSLLALMKE